MFTPRVASSAAVYPRFDFGLVDRGVGGGDAFEPIPRRAWYIQPMLVHAAAITRRRATAEGPDVALLMAVGDTFVPNSATAALVQAAAVIEPFTIAVFDGVTPTIAEPD